MVSYFKDGVKIDGVKKETIELMLLLNGYFVAKIGKPFVVTSCMEGKHMKGSKHYSGYAVDIRIRHLSVCEMNNLLAWFKINYDKEYDMVVEKDHLHIEYDPK